MILGPVVFALTGIGLSILQSTMLQEIIPLSVVPDLAMIFLAASAWRSGSLSGELSGFLIGLVVDFLGLAPLGFHAFIYTVIGYLFGRMRDSIAPGHVLLPVASAAVATLIKYSGSFLISLVFGLNSVASRFFSLTTVIELAINVLLSPAVFLVVSLLSGALKGRRGGFR